MQSSSFLKGRRMKLPRLLWNLCKVQVVLYRHQRAFCRDFALFVTPMTCYLSSMRWLRVLGEQAACGLAIMKELRLIF